MCDQWVPCRWSESKSVLAAFSLKESLARKSIGLVARRVGGVRDRGIEKHDGLYCSVV